MQFKNYTYTCHKLNPIHIAQNDLLSFNICGTEICPTTGKQHYQGYAQLHKKTTLSTLKKKICDSCHYEIARGTAQQNINYCSKEGKSVQFGQPKEKGHRSDLDVVTDKVKENIPLRDIVLEHPSTYIRNYRGIKDFMCIVTPPKIRNVKLYKRKDTPEWSEDIWYADYTGLNPNPKGYYGQKSMVVKGNYADVPECIRSGFPCIICDVPCQIESIYYFDKGGF